MKIINTKKDTLYHKENMAPIFEVRQSKKQKLMEKSNTKKFKQRSSKGKLENEVRTTLL